MRCWSIDGEELQVALLLVSLHQREFDRRIVELLDVVSACLGSDDLFDFDDLKTDKYAIKNQ